MCLVVVHLPGSAGECQAGDKYQTLPSLTVVNKEEAGRIHGDPGQEPYARAEGDHRDDGDDRGEGQRRTGLRLHPEEGRREGPPGDRQETQGIALLYHTG